MSSSSAEQIDEIEATKLLCHCNALVKCRERGRPGNPARCFVNCAKSMISRDACRFFQWVDPPLNKHYRDTINHLKALIDGTEVQRLEVQLENVQLSLAQEKKMRATEQETYVTEQVLVAVKIAGFKGEVARLRKAMKMVIIVSVLVVVGILVSRC